MKLWSSCICLVAFVLLPIAVGSVIGCSGPQRAKAVDETLALETLHRTMEIWKAGQSIESCQSESPPVVAQETDWSAGLILESYEVLRQQRRDANLFVTVRMKLRDNSQPEKDPMVKERTYIVGTNPVLTVFRDMN